MAKQSDPKVLLSKPKDRSLEAFKAWIQEMHKHVGGGGKGMTEEEWKQKHEAFWKKADEAK